jgi:hypothetical protein
MLRSNFRLTKWNQPEFETSQNSRSGGKVKSDRRVTSPIASPHAVVTSTSSLGVDLGRGENVAATQINSPCGVQSGIAASVQKACCESSGQARIEKQVPYQSPAF